MIFAELPLGEAEGAVLAYAVSAGRFTLRKGTVLGGEHIAALGAAGIGSVIAARLEPDDVGEDEAALRIARALASGDVEIGAATTGRVNLFARRGGVFRVDAAGIDALNRLDPRIGVATLHNHVRVAAGQMIATVKIVPFAVPSALADAICAMAVPGPLLEARPFREIRVGLIQSRLPSTREPVLDRTLALMEKRVAGNGGRIAVEKRMDHDGSALAAALAEIDAACDLIVVFSASAIADEDDVVPRAIRKAGGEILRLGVPVDPGNLLALGRRGEKYILVAPGSARNARANSLDRVLAPLMAGIALDADDLAEMGVGGLLF